MAKLPENKQEWEIFKAEFIEMGLEDAPETWTFVLSQLQNTKMPELQFDPKNVLAHYKRWKIAKVLQDEKAVYIAQLQDKLKAKLESLEKEMSNEGASSQQAGAGPLREGAPDIQGDVPGLPEPSEAVVHPH